MGRARPNACLSVAIRAIPINGIRSSGVYGAGDRSAAIPIVRRTGRRTIAMPHGCDSRAERAAVTPGEPGVVGSVQPTALSDPATVERVVRVGRLERCRPKHEQSLRAASL
jgi:hypothetical protein